MEKNISLDEMPMNRFHLLMTARTIGAHFSDGYAMGTIALAIPMLQQSLQLSTVWQGLLGSSALIGIFLGSLIVGRISDSIGRKTIFHLTPAMIVVASLLQFFVQDAIQLFILRLVIGFGVGGDYTVGVTLLTEFIPSRIRGMLVAFLNAAWTAGYLLSTVIGNLLQGGEDVGRWLLASAAIPAMIIFFLRLGTPESPRWLIRMGRQVEAQRIVTKYVGTNILIIETEASGLGVKMLWSKKYLKTTLFVGLFWMLCNIAFFAIYTFLPIILGAFGVAESYFTSMMLNAMLLLGGLAGVAACYYMKRRTFAISSYFICAAALLALSFVPASMREVFFVLFAIFTFTISAQTGLTNVYPAEVFPTEVRTSGLGFAVAMSRIGSAITTFILPLMIAGIGITATMVILSAAPILGTIISIAWAPETKDLSLTEAATGNLSK